MNKKFEFTGETKINKFGKTLHRIKALVQIKFEYHTIEIGELGGWLEKENNLNESGNAWVYGNAEVSGNAIVYGNAEVSGNAMVYGNAEVSGNAWVYDNAEVSDNAEVYGNAMVYGNAEVLKIEHIFVAGPMGSRNSFTTFYRNKKNNIEVKCGCFNGELDKFLDKVRETHGDSKYAKAYRAAAVLAVEQIELDEE